MLVKRIDELKNLNRRLLSENEVLRRQLLDDQQDRVKFVMEIAKRERGNVYNDITSLIENQERFGLDSLLEYSPSKSYTTKMSVNLKEKNFSSVPSQLILY